MSAPTGPHFTTSPAKRLTMLLSVHDHAHHRSLVTEIVKRARRADVSGATAFQAQEGFGASRHAHRTGLVSNDAPVTMVIVDRPDRIDTLLEDLGHLLDDVLVTVTDVEIVTV